MYNHKMVDTKQDSETGKKVSINQINRDLRKNTYTCRYVSLSQKDQADFAHHKKVKAALKSVSEHKWFKPWWPVGPYIRTVQGRIMHVKGYFAHRKAGKIEHDQEIVVTI